MWNALFDALVFCVSEGFSEDSVQAMLPDTFKEVYQSLKRKEAIQNTTMLAIVNQANHGTKQSIKKFTEDLSAWLPAKGTDNKAGLSGYKALLQGNKLKGGGRK